MFNFIKNINWIKIYSFIRKDIGIYFFQYLNISLVYLSNFVKLFKKYFWYFKKFLKKKLTKYLNIFGFVFSISLTNLANIAFFLFFTWIIFVFIYINSVNFFFYSKVILSILTWIILKILGLDD